MDDLKLTRWFPRSVEPVRYGWYDVQTPDGIKRAYWRRGWLCEWPTAWPFRVEGVQRWRGSAAPIDGAGEGEWGASVVGHPKYIREQQDKNRRMRALVDSLPVHSAHP